jgi:membrane-associated phospholipid phosphatase
MALAATDRETGSEAGRATARRALLALLLAVGAVAALAAGARLVCAGDACHAPAVDTAGLAALHAWGDRRLDPAVAALTWLGSIALLLPLAALLAWRWRRSVPGRVLAFLPLALLGATALAQAAKFLVARPRPDLFPALVTMPADASFPSAHAMQATAFALAWLLRPGARPGPLAAAAAGLLVLAVAGSRVYLQVHFPTDVLFGVTAAALWVVALRCAPVWPGASR